MNAGNWFWIIYVVFLLFGGYVGFTNDGVNRRHWGIGVVMFILAGLLGWGIFGPPIH